MSAAEAYGIHAVDRGGVLRYLGYAGQELSPELDGRIDETVAGRSSRPSSTAA